MSYADVGGGVWRVRWREKEGSRYVSRSTTLEGLEREAIARVLEVRRALDELGTFDASRAAASRQPPANLLQGLEAFIDTRRQAGRFSANTARTYGSYKLRVMDHLHAIAKVPRDRPLPVTALSREAFEEMNRRDRITRASAQTAYASLRFLLTAWTWLADDPERWPHVPVPPRSTRDYLPRTPKYSRTVAPTLAHVDACLRHLPPKTAAATRMLGVFMRYTGLRADTLLSLQHADLDLGTRVLHVRGDDDKNGYDRWVPLADALVEEVGAWLELAEGPLVFGAKRRHAKTGSGPKKKPTETYKAAWRAATAAGLVPEHVWNPPNRHHARPEHSLRAAFDAHLIDVGVEPRIVDYLVGRKEEDQVRGTHYSGELLRQAREAVNQLPAIDWGTS